MHIKERVNYGRVGDLIPLGNLIATQKDSFRWFRADGIAEVFAEMSPITDYSNKSYELHLLDYEFRAPKFSVEECGMRDMTFSAGLWVRTRLLVKEFGEIKESEVYMGDFPIMTDEGTFVVNGTQRVVVSQLMRSPGAYFMAEQDPASGRNLFGARLIPGRGAWLELETTARNIVYAKIDRKRKFPVTTLLKALALPELKAVDGDAGRLADKIREMFADIDPNGTFINPTLDKDTARTCEEAMVEVYRKVRPGDMPSMENARNFIDSQFFNSRRYDLGKVGRYKLDRRLARFPEDEIRKRAHDTAFRAMDKSDMLAIVRELFRLNTAPPQDQISDEVDHLGNRRIRGVGELLQNQFRMGMVRLERIAKERMTIADPQTVTPASLISARPVVASIKEFFGSSQLSQFMEQTNPLAELTHKRRLSALGPGGLSRERAGFEVRDVHHSHYGRICPIESPEGANIGLIGSLASYARVNEFGFVETPVRKIYQNMPAGDPKLVGRKLFKDMAGLSAGSLITETENALLKKAKVGDVAILPWLSEEIEFLAADQEEKFAIAQTDAKMNPDGTFIDAKIATRDRGHFAVSDVKKVAYMDISPKQIVSVAAAMIPFLEHDDANRALMGANMQRQAVPLIRVDAPMVGTGVEAAVAADSGEMVIAEKDGVIIDIGRVRVSTSVHVNAGQEIVLRPNDGSGDISYQLTKFARSNQGTCFNMRVVVKPGQEVKAGEILAEGASIDGGEMALGRNVLVAMMPWEGYNFEDAILLSETVVREDAFTSIHIEEFETEARDTKLGPEEITRELPSITEDQLRNLDERGIVTIGSEVNPGDILVGKVTPKGETELSAEERLLRAIFGERSREVRDSSLRIPHGERGTVVDVKVFSRANHDELSPGVNELVRIFVAQKRKITIGDKMANRHGNKGVVARILPVEDMPFLPDGRPIEIVLNPLGVPSRMNIGQVLETHLGWVAKSMGMKTMTPVFDGATLNTIKDELIRAGLPESGKITLRDGRSGAEFKAPVMVGYMYLLKLAHLVEDKIHARSTGPYSLVTQQPLGGKAQFGGQRFGEMEVWALEAYGAAHVLQEILTVKSDDIVGRVKAYEAIIKGEDNLETGVPESFRVLVKELEGLGLAVEILGQDERQIILTEEETGDAVDLGISLERDELGGDDLVEE